MKKHHLIHLYLRTDEGRFLLQKGLPFQLSLPRNKRYYKERISISLLIQRAVVSPYSYLGDYSALGALSYFKEHFEYLRNCE